MQVILLERVAKLGHMGEVVKVKDGFARNFLLPNHKALRATDANKAKFERDRASLEARNADRRQEAESEAKGLDGKSFVLIRQAGESGQLYGSVSPRDIAEAALWFASDRSAQVTAQIMAVDAGATAGSPFSQIADIMAARARVEAE